MLFWIEYIIYMNHISHLYHTSEKKLNLPTELDTDKHTMDYKALIIQELGVLRTRDAATPGGHFKVRAYDKVIKQLTTHGPIHSIDDIASIEGIGAKIHDKITEILATGRLASADTARKEHSIDALTAFNKIYGVGPVKAKELVKNGFKTIEELAANTASLNENQRKGLKYYYDFLERIPRAEMEKHEQIIRTASNSAQLVGSYRRGAANSGDIDVIVKAAGDESATLDKIVAKPSRHAFICN